MISDKSIQDFVKDHVKSVSYGKYKVKEVIITHIERISGFDFIVADYKVFLYKSGFNYTSKNDLFTPNSYSCVDGALSIDLADPQTKRALLIDDILD